MNKNKRSLILLIVFIASTITACGPRVEPTPTMEPAAIMTMVALTVEANVTQAAQLTPSPTVPLPPTATQPPVPTPPTAPTQPLPPLPTTPVNGGAGAVPTIPVVSPDNATFIKDVDVKDGAVFWQKERFTKTWKIENSGTTTWDTDYKLIYYDGAYLTETSVISIQKPVEPGTQVELSVKMVAPDALGSYTSYWKMINNEGAPFGDTLSVEILVGTEYDKTPTPSG